MENTSMTVLKYPRIICGGMGVFISNPLTPKVSTFEWHNTANVALGTLSGVALERIMARMLQFGGRPAEELKRVLLNYFPFPDVADEVIREFYMKKRGTPVWSLNPSSLLIKLTVCANFAFVWLAKEGHSSPISINYLEKIATPHLYAIYGAMLAGVNFITMGAGIPLLIPEVIKAYMEGREATYHVPAIGIDGKIKMVTMVFNPRDFFGNRIPQLSKPGFIPIVASHSLASVLKGKLPEGSIYGFGVEIYTAGGHNAPPRIKVFDKQRRPLPLYGWKDEVHYSEIRDLGLPFWIGGGLASPEGLAWARSEGAEGIQVGSLFALSQESGLRPDLKSDACRLGWRGELPIRKDMQFSPTKFPFQVAVLNGTAADGKLNNARTRVCIHGVLVTHFERPDGTFGKRCPGGPIDRFIRNGGKIEDTENCGCLCESLLTGAGLGEGLPVVTLGDDLSFLRKVMPKEDSPYSVVDALNYLLKDAQITA